MHSFHRNVFNCECGGLRHICAKHGCLPDSRDCYRQPERKALDYVVVWSGGLQRQGISTVQLVPDRVERPDARLWAMPTYDLDDGEVIDNRPRRKYNLTGRHVGKFSRTNPNAPHYKPTVKPEADPSEASHG